MDSDSPLQITLHNTWIRALRDNPQIACSICGSHKPKGAKHGFDQTIDWSWKILRMYTVSGMVLLPHAWRCYYVYMHMGKECKCD